MLRIYAGRREALLAILQRDFASWLQPVPSSAGLHVSAVTRLDADDRDLEKRALRAGVGVRALSHFAVRQGARRGVIFGYGAIGEASIVEGLGRLRRALV
jgi:GntR family transcriptional regulator/MocR family aminotransferase